MRLAMLTLVVGDDYKTCVSAGLRSKQRYCERHRIDCIIDETRYLPDWPIPWSKLVALQHQLARYDVVFLSDADVLITNSSFDIRGMLEQVFRQDRDLLINSELNFDQQGRVTNAILNSGNFFIRNTAWSQEFLARWQGMSAYKDAEYWEQSALNAGDLAVQKPIQYCYNQHLFNSFGTSYFNGWQPGDFLLHAARWPSQSLMALFQYLSPFSNTTPAMQQPHQGEEIEYDRHNYTLGAFGRLMDAVGRYCGDWFPLHSLSFDLHPGIRRSKALPRESAPPQVRDVERAVMVRFSHDTHWWSFDVL